MFVQDSTGVIHVYEQGAKHNTRCGWMFAGAPYLKDATLSCLFCIGGPSHFTVDDLIDGEAVSIGLVCADPKGVILSRTKWVTFSYGENQEDVAFSAPEDFLVVSDSYTIASWMYCNSDSVVLRGTTKAAVVLLKGDRVSMDKHKVRITRG